MPGPRPVRELGLQPDPVLDNAGAEASASGLTAKLESGRRQHYVSRLPFHALPGKTREVEQRLGELQSMIVDAGGERCRILRPHFASDGAPDLLLEQEVDSLATLEAQINSVTANPRFQAWTTEMSPLLVRSPKREILLVTSDGW